MKIGVILRKISFFYGSESGIDFSTNELNYSGMLTILNPFDEGALVLALEKKDSIPQINVSVIAMGDKDNTIDLIENGINLGADIGFLYNDHPSKSSFFQEDPYKWSKFLSSINWDLLLLGANRTDIQEDGFGIILGEYLNIDVVSSIIDFQTLSNGRLRCIRKLEKGNREFVECKLPALLTVEQINKLRYPTLKRIASPKEKYIICVEEKFEKVEKNERIVFLRYAPPRARTKKGSFELNESTSPLNIFDKLLGRMDQKGKTFEEELKGPPDKIAEKFIEYLIKIGIL